MTTSELSQPPSGGCVLKLKPVLRLTEYQEPAAFGRLCVETPSAPALLVTPSPAAFGRLCVETVPLP